MILWGNRKGMDKDSKGQRKMEDSGGGYFLQWKDTAIIE